MLFILDYQQNTIGVANNGSPLSLPYFEDIHEETLEGINTYSFSVPSDHADAELIQAEGHVIITNLEGEQILFTIKEVSNGQSDGKRVKQVYCEETAVNELLGAVQRPATITASSLEHAVETVLANTTEWKLLNCPYTESRDIEFSDYMTVLEALRFLMEEYGMEIYFTVKLSGTRIIEKYIVIVEQRGNVTDVRFDYSFDLVGVSRTENSENVATALIGVGVGDANSKRVDLTQTAFWEQGDFYHEAGSDWIGSRKALTQWGKNGTHRFGIFVSENADTAQELRRQTIKELEKRIEPTVNYSASILTLERLTDYEAKAVRLGDTIAITDFTFATPLSVNGRIVSTKRSYTQPDQDSVELGSYKPRNVSPNKEIKDLQKIISKGQEGWKASGYTVTVECLEGTAFKNGTGRATLRAKVFNGNTEVSEQPDGMAFEYRWFKFNKDGKMITLWGGSTDYRTGKELTITSLDVTDLATFVCYVNDGK